MFKNSFGCHFTWLIYCLGLIFWATHSLRTLQKRLPFFLTLNVALKKSEVNLNSFLLKFNVSFSTRITEDWLLLGFLLMIIRICLMDGSLCKTCLCKTGHFCYISMRVSLHPPPRPFILFSFVKIRPCICTNFLEDCPLYYWSQKKAGAEVYWSFLWKQMLAQNCAKTAQ